MAKYSKRMSSWKHYRTDNLFRLLGKQCYNSILYINLAKSEQVMEIILFASVDKNQLVLMTHIVKNNTRWNINFEYRI